MSPITATHQHGGRTQYRLQGGAWDGPDLDTLLRDAPGPRIGAPHDALVDGDIRLTAADIDDLTGALAGGLRDLGVRRRDAVAWQLAPGYESVLLYRACWRLGAVAVPIAPSADDATVSAVLAMVEPVVLVGAKHLPLGRHREAVVVGGPSLPTRRVRAGTEAGDGDAAPGAPAARSGAPFAKLLAAEPVLAGAARASDVAVVFTSPVPSPVAGSSRVGGQAGAAATFTPGHVRGIIHTHRTLAAKARTMPERDGLGSADVALIPAPLTSATGLLHALVVPTLAGMTTIVLPEWNPAIALDVIERERVSFLAGTPGAIRGLLREPSFSSRRVRSVRLVTLTGDAVSPAVAARAASLLGARVKRSYGSSEAPMITASSPAAGEADAHHTDGRAIGDTELRVVEPVTTRDCAPGTEGEVWVRGPEVFAGYVDADDNAAAFARGGWYRTGDLGVLDDTGALTVTGTIEAGICDGDRAIGTGMLEAWLQADARLDDAAVVSSDRAAAARPLVTAFVTLADGEGDAGGAGASRAIAVEVWEQANAWLEEDDDAPAVVLDAVRVVRSLPVRPSGQIDRRALRATVSAHRA